MLGLPTLTNLKLADLDKGTVLKVIRSPPERRLGSRLPALTCTPHHDKHVHVAPQLPIHLHGCLSEVYFESFQRPYFWTFF